MGNGINGGWSWIGEEFDAALDLPGFDPAVKIGGAGEPGSQTNIIDTFESGPLRVTGAGIVDTSGRVSRERIQDISIGIGIREGVDARIGIGSEKAYMSMTVSFLGESKTFPITELRVGNVRNDLESYFGRLPNLVLPANFDEILDEISIAAEAKLADLKEYAPEQLHSEMQLLYEAAAALRGDWPVDTFEECFPAHTPILTSLTTSTAISALRAGDIVLAYDPRANNGRGALTPRRIKRLYRNTTTEWVVLRWVEAGEARELTLTPGHHVLDALGAFPTTPDMTRTGSATVVLASGGLTQVTAGRTPICADMAPGVGRGGGLGRAAGKGCVDMGRGV